MVSWQKMMSRLPDENLKKKFTIFFWVIALANFGIENLWSSYLKNYYS